MIKFLHKICFGERAPGKKINYEEKVIVRTVVPFNMPYAIWVQSVKEFGYQDLIRFIENYRKYKSPQVLGLPKLS